MHQEVVFPACFAMMDSGFRITQYFLVLPAIRRVRLALEVATLHNVSLALIILNCLKVHALNNAFLL